MTSSDQASPAASAFRALRRLLRAVVRERSSRRNPYTTTWTELRFVTERDELDGGWIAYCLDLPGCAGQGETEDAALNDAASASVEIIKFRLQEAFAEHRHEPSIASKPHQVSVAI